MRYPSQRSISMYKVTVEKDGTTITVSTSGDIERAFRLVRESIEYENSKKENLQCLGTNGY